MEPPCVGLLRWLRKKMLGKQALWFSMPLMRNSAPIVITRSNANVPARWRGEVERILITDRQIARRVRSMSLDIERDFARREMVVVSLLNGTVTFLADLIRNLSLPLRLDFIGVSSYCSGTESCELVYSKELRLEGGVIGGLLDGDILDTGNTRS